MDSKKIIWSENAIKEFQDILAFYADRNGNPNFSLKLIQLTDDMLNTVSKSENIGRVTINRNTRVIPLKEFLLFYEIRQESIEILSYWDNRQSEEEKVFK
jgi:toxin YoeB